MTLADVPGYMPGLEQERGGVIRRGAKLFYGYNRVEGPDRDRLPPQGLRRRLCDDGCKQGDNDINLAWPTAEIAVMGAPAAVKVPPRAGAHEDHPGRRRCEGRVRIA